MDLVVATKESEGTLLDCSQSACSRPRLLYHFNQRLHSSKKLSHNILVHKARPPNTKLRIAHGPLSNLFLHERSTSAFISLILCVFLFVSYLEFSICFLLVTIFF